jgi:dolichyl-diphosphooligosaccharide---protein glycosyltransferase
MTNDTNNKQGMQFTAVFIKSYVLPNWSLNDVCCYMPAWFGVVATTITGLIAYECVNDRARSLWTLLNEFLLGGSNNNGHSAAVTASLPKRPAPAIMCGVCAAAMMAIVPAHLMRSMGGGYDNESVANTTMVLTFYCWIKSLNNGGKGSLSHTLLWSVLTGLSYFYMVATWGGYVFVLNLIAIHAMFLTVRFSTKLYLAYTIFYMIGTTLAVQIPVVGWAPLKSLEQLGALAVFAAYQVMFVSDNLVLVMGRKDRTTRRVSLVQQWQYRIMALAGAGVVAGLLVYLFLPASYFGPISSRVRGLFVKHTKTGNPLVDSVAEHQPASSRAYFQYLHHVCSLAPIGYVMTIVLGLTDSSSFLLVWGAAAYFFSNKMVRLILLTAPIGSILGGIAAGRLFAWAMAQWTDDDNNAPDTTTTTRTESGSEAVNGSGGGGNSSPLRPPKAALKNKKVANKSTNRSLNTVRSHMKAFRASKEGIIAQRIASVVIIVSSYMLSSSYISYCWRLSQDLSNPSIIVKARLRDGRVVKLDDYREAYWWLRDNTPKDARVMAWWDCKCLFVVVVVLQQVAVQWHRRSCCSPHSSLVCTHII